MLWYVQADGVCKPHVEGPDKGAAEATAADISQLPDLALELIFNAQLPNLARPACVCSSHLKDRDAASRCISDALSPEAVFLDVTNQAGPFISVSCVIVRRFACRYARWQLCLWRARRGTRASPRCRSSTELPTISALASGARSQAKNMSAAGAGASCLCCSGRLLSLHVVAPTMLAALHRKWLQIIQAAMWGEVICEEAMYAPAPAMVCCSKCF